MSSTIDTAVRAFFARHEIAPCALVAAVSGGADSTALLLVLAEMRTDGFTLVAAHVNHRLRGVESEEDEQFVRDLCARFDVPLHVADGSLDSDRVRERGIEAAAREVRYLRLAELRERTGARFIATAHQKDDQAETVLMRLLGGSGIAGLRGIHPVREDGFIRPLLEVARAEIDAFLRDRNIEPRHDRSNDDPRFLRNRVRRIVRELGATDNLATLADHARQQWPLLEQRIDDAEREFVDARETETIFRAMPENEWLRGALLQRHIRRLDPSARDFDAERIAGQLHAIRKISVTKKLEMLRERDAWILRARPRSTPQFTYDLRPCNSVDITEIGATIHLEPSSQQLPTAGRQRIQLPHAESQPTFIIRNRRNGDRFQPLGLASPKKLKDFLIDRRIPRESRDRIPLLVWNDEILCVLGVEISERFRITASAGPVFEVWMEDARARPADDHSGVQR